MKLSSIISESASFLKLVRIFLIFSLGAVFAFQDSNPSAINTRANLGSVSVPILGKNLLDRYNSEGISESFIIKETSNLNQVNKLIHTRLRYLSGMADDFSDIIIVDAHNRALPIEVNAISIGRSAELTMRVSELNAGQNNRFRLLYGKCHNLDFSLSQKETSSEAKGHIIVSDFLSNIIDKEKVGIGEKKLHAEVMDCNCKVSQGNQSFAFKPIENALDDVAFFAYNEDDNASANTGFERNDAAVLFLYENTITGEVSLFVILDAAGGGRDGSGGIDFYCLPMTATLDFSDDNGEITTLMPTVVADWRWADCCTDGAIIGNLGCNDAFDFIPDFNRGISKMHWVSGSMAKPDFHTFQSINSPVTIQCGKTKPSCCPNNNVVKITNVSCPKESDGAIDIIPDDKGSPYMFSWSTGADSEDLSCLSDGDYTVTITDNKDCVQVSKFTIGIKPNSRKIRAGNWAGIETDIENQRKLVCAEVGINLASADKFIWHF